MGTINLPKQVYGLVQQILVGKVTTYGEIGRVLGIHDSRLIGYALHRNQSKDVPCHRVVNREGRIAPNFAFDGAVEQHHRLEAEGIQFIDDMHVDMKKHFYRF